MGWTIRPDPDSGCQGWRRTVVVVTTFADLEDAAPTIAEFLGERIVATRLCFLGTTRSDGWPRVSPLEVFLHDGRIYMGSMPGAMKARDLQRDPRCCVITPLADHEDHGGEAKLFCRAREVHDRDEWEAVRARFKELSGFDMGEPGGAHLFTFDIEGAAYQRVEAGETFRTTSWHPGRGIQEFGRGATGERIEL
jgi:nitroimidazol reductase NimA-like FMN-containing flavoprotein (pyridoxamine 5'-phosphate oxidase superfamily)